MVDIKRKFSIKLLSNIVYYLVLVFLVVIAASVALSELEVPGGIRLFTVQSGSMEPAIKIGSVVIVMPKDDYSQGDIITFKDAEDPKITITHRINEVEEEAEERLFVTKGDANEGADMERTSKENILGKVRFSVPYLGYPVAFAKTQMGFVMLIIIPGTLIIYSEFLNIKKEIGRILENRKNKKQGEEKE